MKLQRHTLRCFDLFSNPLLSLQISNPTTFTEFAFNVLMDYGDADIVLYGGWWPNYTGYYDESVHLGDDGLRLCKDYIYLYDPNWDGKFTIIINPYVESKGILNLFSTTNSSFLS